MDDNVTQVLIMLITTLGTVTVAWLQTHRARVKARDHPGTTPKPKPRRQFPLADLIVFFFSAVLGAVILFATIGTIVLHVENPKADATVITDSLSVVNILVGAVIGYLAGRGVKPPPPPF